MTGLPAPSSIAAAISPGGFLSFAFPGASWDLWRTILKAVEGTKLSRPERRALPRSGATGSLLRGACGRRGSSGAGGEAR